MASKITPLYAQTRILLNLWSLDDRTPVAKKGFFPGQGYQAALDYLVKEGFVVAEKVGRYPRYAITDSGETKLAEGLASDDFSFRGSTGAKTTNAILRWLRQDIKRSKAGTAPLENSVDPHTSSQNGKAAAIDSYETFSETTLKTYDRLNRDYNLDDMVPIYRIRRELGDRLSRQQFNEWLLELQSEDRVQLMGSDLSDVTADQMEDSIAIPGAGARFFAKRL